MIQRSIVCCLGLGLALSLASLVSMERARAEDPVPVADDGRVTLPAKASAREGGKLTFLWKQIDGPSVKIADPGAARLDETDPQKKRWVSETFFVPTEPGIYRFELSVKNEDGKESKKIFEKDVLAPKPAPVAVAGQDQNNRNVNDLIRVNGSDSKCADGQMIVQWQWEVVQAPPKFSPDPELLKKAAWDFKARDAGIYQFMLRVSDGKHWSVPSPPIVITIKPESLPPQFEPDEGPKKWELGGPAPNPIQPPRIIVKAIVAPGGDVKLGQTLVLDGSASHPPADMNPQFFWHQTDDKGPIVRQLSPDHTKPFDSKRDDTNNYPVWTFKPEKPGTYSFVLKLTLNAGTHNEAEVESEPVTYNVIDPNAQPVAAPAVPAGGPALFARISAETVTVDAGDTVRLDASTSYGPKGAKLKYVWGPVAGKLYPRAWSGSDSPLIEFRTDDQGEYGISLRVSDGKDESLPDQIIITSGPAKGPPVIDLPAEYTTTVGEKLTMEAHVTDPKNDKLSLKWVCVQPAEMVIRDDSSKKDISTLPSIVFKPNKPGPFVFKLTATDSKGHSTSVVTTITVKVAEDRQPTAKLEGPADVLVGHRVVLDASGSRSGNNLQLSYLWKQESGPAIPGDAPSHKQKTWEFTPKETGQYKVSLQVSDANAKSYVDVCVVNVVAEQHALAAKIAGPPAVKLNPGESIALDGSDSSDGADNKTKLKFKWSKLDGTAELSFEGDDAPKCKITGASSGPARVQLVISDGTSESPPAIVVVSVGKARGKPAAKIAGPADARINSTVILSSEGSTAEGEVTGWLWTQTQDGGPKIPGLSKSDMRKKELRFEPKQPGTYVFTLQVVDEKGNKSEPETHSVEVKGGVNRQPIAHASVIQQVNGPIQANNPVKLSARGSIDPENHALKYKWKQVAGDPVQMPEGGGEIVNIVPPAPGKYTFEVVVSAGENDSVPAEVSFNVEGPNAAPEAKIGDIQPVEVGEKIVLDGSESKSGNGGKLEYRWSKVSGPDVRFVGRNAESKVKAEVILQQDGEYVFELKVFDGKDWSEAARAAVKTRAPNVAPIAVISSPNNGKIVNTEENMESVLDGSESNDPDNGPKPLTFLWKQTSGSRVDLRPEGKIVRFTPARQGELKFQLIVNDGKASSASMQVVVNVLKAGTLPVAVADYKPKPARVAERNRRDEDRRLNKNVLILDGARSKPQGKRLAYQWKQIGGEDLHLKPEKLNKDQIGMLIYVPGAYKFTLVVSDDQNTSQPAVLEFNVLDDTPTAVSPAPAPASSPEANQKQPEKTESTPDSKTPSSSDAGHRDGALLPPPKDAKDAGGDPGPSRAVPPRSSDAEKKKLEDLARQPGAEAEKTLIEALSNPDAGIRKTAAEALYSRGITSIPALIATLDSSDASARGEAYRALKELTHETFGSESDKWRDWWAAQPVARTGTTNEQNTP